MDTRPLAVMGEAIGREELAARTLVAVPVPGQRVDAPDSGGRVDGNRFRRRPPQRARRQDRQHRRQQHVVAILLEEHRVRHHHRRHRDRQPQRERSNVRCGIPPYCCLRVVRPSCRQETVVADSTPGYSVDCHVPVPDGLAGQAYARITRTVRPPAVVASNVANRSSIGAIPGLRSNSTSHPLASPSFAR